MKTGNLEKALEEIRQGLASVGRPARNTARRPPSLWRPADAAPDL